MPYLAVDKDGIGAIYTYLPKRGHECWVPAIDFTGKFSSRVYISKNLLFKLAGKTLAWEDEPFEITD